MKTADRSDDDKSQTACSSRIAWLDYGSKGFENGLVGLKVAATALREKILPRGKHAVIGYVYLTIFRTDYTTMNLNLLTSACEIP
jgi:hypothetical protein